MRSRESAVKFLNLMYDRLCDIDDIDWGDQYVEVLKYIIEENPPIKSIEHPE